MPANPQPAHARWCALETDPSGRARLTLRGAWHLPDLAAIERALRAQAIPPRVILAGADLESIDTSAAWALAEALRAAGLTPAKVELHDFEPVTQRVVERVFRLGDAGEALPRRKRLGGLGQFGLSAVEIGRMCAGHVTFLGETTQALAQLVRNPMRLRLKELTVQFEQCGLNAIPVVALVTFLIGIVIAYLLGLQAEKYGANLFVVDGVGIGTTREFAPIIVAVIVAGRSGAAFTAQLGAMRLGEEIDAISTLGLSPQHVLVVPRVLALMVALPLLVFIGDAMSILGALWIAEPMLDITPATFLSRLREALAVKHVVVGLAKAPVFAFFIALIGARMGMTVGRDTRAVGLATTSTVVQSIVAVILLDAAFAVIFQRLGI
ncbi:MAG TPA: ABC transporter permease [Burkholderiaceae bacterium]|nr:ABC transporter permease [Burkholderiaceae bacterium]